MSNCRRGNPGTRLRSARLKKGFKTRRNFHHYLVEQNKFFTYKKLGQLERNEADPSIREVKVLCDVLNMSADYYLREGLESKKILIDQIQKMSVEQCSLLLHCINMANHFSLEDNPA